MNELVVGIWLEAFYQAFRAKYLEHVDRVTWFVEVRKATRYLNSRPALSSAGCQQLPVIRSLRRRHGEG